jgi:hypothetical protein
MHRVNFFVVLLVATIAITIPVRAQADLTRDEMRARLIQLLQDPEHTPGKRAEFVVTDPALILPVIEAEMTRLGPRDSFSRTDIRQLEFHAPSAYFQMLRKPQGLRALEGKIAALYASPRVTRRPSKLARGQIETVVDYGWLAGPLKSDRGAIEVVRQGDRFERGWPSSRFLAGLIARAVRDHSSEARVVVRIDAPEYRADGQFEIGYTRQGWDDSLNGWIDLTTRSARGLLPVYRVQVPNEDFSVYGDGRYTLFEDCTPLPVPRGGRAMGWVDQRKGRCAGID